MQFEKIHSNLHEQLLLDIKNEKDKLDKKLDSLSEDISKVLSIPDALNYIKTAYASNFDFQRIFLCEIFTEFFPNRSVYAQDYFVIAKSDLFNFVINAGTFEKTLSVVLVSDTPSKPYTSYEFIENDFSNAYKNYIENPSFKTAFHTAKVSTKRYPLLTRPYFILKSYSKLTKQSKIKEFTTKYKSSEVAIAAYEKSISEHASNINSILSELLLYRTELLQLIEHDWLITCRGFSFSDIKIIDKDVLLNLEHYIKEVNDGLFER